MGNYITYTLKALENIKMGQTLKRMGQEDTMDYITGSAIRGAYIYRYMKHNKVKDINQGEHRRKLLNGGIKFLNAYPSHGGVRSIPMPKCYFAPKEAIKCFTDNLPIKVGIDQKLKAGYEKVKLSEFIMVKGDSFENIRVNKISNLHIKKNVQENELFQYEAISKGQIFQGIIKAKEEDTQEVIDLLKEAIVYIGGSKGSGYGKCQISNVKRQSENPEMKVEFSRDFGEELYIIALSDILYRNELGKYKTSFDEEFLRKKLQLNKIEFIESSIETKDVTTFNNKWRCSTPLIRGIKGGSVFKYKIKEGVDQGLCTQLMNQGIGERKQDGYGRILILPYLDDVLLRKAKAIESKPLDTCNTFNKDKEKQVKKIIKQILKLKTEQLIPSIVITEYEKFKNPQKMKASQWGKYMDLFMYLQVLPLEQAKQVYSEHIDHVRSKKNNPLKKVQYQNNGDPQNLEEYLDSCIQSHIDPKEVYISHYFPDGVDIEGMEVSLTSETVFKVNMKILTEICRYHLRKGDES